MCSIGGKAGRDKGKVDGIAGICRKVNGATVPHTVARFAVKGVGKIAQVDIPVRVHHIFGGRHKDMVRSVVASGIPCEGVAAAVGQVDGGRDEPFSSIARHAVAARVVADARGMPSVPVVKESAAARIAYPLVLPVEEMGIDIAAPFGERGHEGQRVAHLTENDTGGDRSRAPSQHVGCYDGDGVEIDSRVGHLKTAALGMQCSFAAVGLSRVPCVGKTCGVTVEECHLERGSVA